MEHTATCASKNRVSRFAVLIADFCNNICQKRTLAELLDHLVGAGEQRRWHIEAERLCARRPGTPLHGRCTIASSINACALVIADLRLSRIQPASGQAIKCCHDD